MSRVREFQGIRHQKMHESSFNSASYLTRDIPVIKSVNIITPSHRFTPRTKTQTNFCITCTNKNTALAKNSKQISEKLQLKNQSQKQHMGHQLLQQKRDRIRQKRQEMQKQVIQANRILALQKKQKAHQDFCLKSKQFQQMIHEQNQKNKKHQQKMHKKQQKDKQLGQYLQSQAKQQKNRLNADKMSYYQDQNKSLQIFYSDSNKFIVEQHTQDLKKQITERLKASQQKKKVDFLQNQRIIKQGNAQFEKYYQLYKRKDQSNPEIFNQLKTLEHQKKFLLNKQRQENYKNRKKDLQLLQKSIFQKKNQDLLQKSRYVKELRQQMLEKKDRQQSEALNSKNGMIKVQKYSENIEQQSRKMKTCEGCSNNYHQKCFI